MVYVFPLIVIAIVVGYLVGIGYYTRRLRTQPKPYSLAWCQRYLKDVMRLRQSIWVVLGLLAANAGIFLIPALFHFGDASAASLFGLVDLLCTIPMWFAWRWSTRLTVLAARFVRLDEQGQPY
ncbi:hypothetical protein [Dictyobacter kobayashii]|uniref:Uncharacterized protein n=1 Tax=Dictyobacter kobayashii TaxID=2014872 RepID=A0A402AHS8_9CHLR|nr:hypothetical protein [Dictyobacter kobayashii]GCE18682.1 hypothetical protein KDK_24820 [Dictyobacter kobayashii]